MASRRDLLRSFLLLRALAWRVEHLELQCLGQRSVHIVSGQVVMRVSGIRQPTPAGEVPITAGHVQLQSEGGEVFFRDI